MKLSELSIADLKALLDYVREQKVERRQYLEEEELEWRDDVGLEQLSLLEFQICRKLDSIVTLNTKK